LSFHNLKNKLCFPTFEAFAILFFFCLFSFIHMCIHCLGHFSTLPPSSTLHPLLLSVPGRSHSALITDFVEEKT
jgi:hypothetical protein